MLESCYQSNVEISNAEWLPREWNADESAIKDACHQNEKCYGYWKGTNGKFGMLQAGERTWAKDKKPNSSVKGVWKKIVCPGKVVFELYIIQVYQKINSILVFVNKEFLTQSLSLNYHATTLMTTTE